MKEKLKFDSLKKHNYIIFITTIQTCERIKLKHLEQFNNPNPVINNKKNTNFLFL